MKEVNVGSAYNDPDSDRIRSSFIKINDDVQEYSLTGIAQELTLTNGTIAITATDTGFDIDTISAGYAGQVISIINVGTDSFTLTMADGNIINNGDNDVVVAARNVVRLVYFDGYWYQD